MGRYLGREPRLSRQDLELEAQQAIDARVSMGRPPAEDWAPIEARLAQMDRAAVPPLAPEPPPVLTGAGVELSLTEVTLPATATAGLTGTAEPPIRVGRRPVGAKER